MYSKKKDRIVAIIFFCLTGIFIFLMIKEWFFDWAFTRHQNQLSWYARPLFLIPFCYFAYKRSLAGIAISLFALLTSMFWFPQPDQVNEKVQEFLLFERKYLTGDWFTQKIILAATIPISLFLLALAFWKRNLWFGILVIVLMAVGKVIWSLKNTGAAGTSIILPAIIGLVLSILIVFFALRKKERK